MCTGGRSEAIGGPNRSPGCTAADIDPRARVHSYRRSVRTAASARSVLSRIWVRSSKASGSRLVATSAQPTGGLQPRCVEGRPRRDRRFVARAWIRSRRHWPRRRRIGTGLRAGRRPAPDAALCGLSRLVTALGAHPVGQRGCRGSQDPGSDCQRVMPAISRRVRGALPGALASLRRSSSRGCRRRCRSSGARDGLACAPLRSRGRSDGLRGSAR